MTANFELYNGNPWVLTTFLIQRETFKLVNKLSGLGHKRNKGTQKSTFKIHTIFYNVRYTA